ncbi:3273_t:CDS:1, partial [Gigaspora margarita]
GIDFSYHEYTKIIRECFNCQHNLANHENEFLDKENEEVETVLINNNTSELAIEELLLSHQQRLTARQNLPDEYDFTTSNSEICNSNDDKMFDGFNKYNYSFFELMNYYIRLKSLDPIKIMKEMTQYR